jgi:hypothetical protein
MLYCFGGLPNAASNLQLCPEMALSEGSLDVWGTTASNLVKENGKHKQLCNVSIMLGLVVGAQCQVRSLQYFAVFDYLGHVQC